MFEEQSQREIRSEDSPEPEDQREGKPPKTSLADQNHPGLEDLWRQAFHFGPLWGQPRFLSQYNWSFPNLEAAFEESGVLHGEEKVFVFGHTQLEMLYYGGQVRPIYIPTVVVVVSSIPPSDKIGILAVETNAETIVDMVDLNMDWVSYIPPGEHERASSSLETPLPQIFIIGHRLQREATLENSDVDLTSFYCLPYFHDLSKVDETEENTVVHIEYAAEAGIIAHEYDWEILLPEGWADMLIEAGKLSKHEKDAFKEFIKQKVEEEKTAKHKAIQKQKEALEELRKTDEKVAAFERMRFYKFYPVASPDTPDFSRYKSAFINEHYGMAHQVM